MARLLLLGLLAGLDNLLVAAAMSVAPVRHARRLWLLAAFAACELASPLTGVLLAHVLKTRLHVSFDGVGPNNKTRKHC
jgi:putative Mn2+ efflux pump MntP